MWLWWLVTWGFFLISSGFFSLSTYLKEPYLMLSELSTHHINFHRVPLLALHLSTVRRIKIDYQLEKYPASLIISQY